MKMDFRNKKIMILGYGREGKDTFLFLKKHFPKSELAVADANPDLRTKEKAKFFLGKDYLSHLKDYDVIIKSPGIPFKSLPEHILPRITTQTELFFDNCPGVIVGITGTKGKSTTSSLIYEILKAGGKKVHLLGNIGTPVLSFLDKAAKKDIFVHELSSHQLYGLRKSPHVSVFLNIFPEHLDYYRSFKEYARAKANITLHQKRGDYLIYNSKDKLVSSFCKKSKARKIPILGEYYELDRNAAREAAKIFKIPSAVAERAIKRFKGLENRLELVGTFKGITFYNDSLATIPEAALLAIDSLGNNVETVILGGFDRGLDFKKLAKGIIKSRIKTLVLFLPTGRRIWKEVSGLDKNKKIRHFFAKNMEEAVKLCFEKTGKGKICLMSPASPSFGMFRDYKERGDMFKKYVKRLAG
jgi:UDP-N-acetylmuramoylalanine--D-glutamate ligase